MMLKLELDPFCGPHTNWKSSPSDHWKSDGAFSPSIMKVTLNCSSTATTSGTSTLMAFWADTRKMAMSKKAAMHNNLFIFTLLPILFLLTGFKQSRLLLIDLVLSLLLAGLDGLQHLLSLLRRDS